MSRIPFVDYPVLCGECGEMLYRKWNYGEEPVYLHSTQEERRGMGNNFDCGNMGKKFKVRNRIVEVEEVPE